MPNTTAKKAPSRPSLAKMQQIKKKAASTPKTVTRPRSEPSSSTLATPAVQNASGNRPSRPSKARMQAIKQASLAKPTAKRKKTHHKSASGSTLRM